MKKITLDDSIVLAGLIVLFIVFTWSYFHDKERSKKFHEECLKTCPAPQPKIVAMSHDSRGDVTRFTWRLGGVRREWTALEENFL